MGSGGYDGDQFGVADSALGGAVCGVCVRVDTEGGGRDCGETKWEDVVLGDRIGDRGAVWRVSGVSNGRRAWRVRKWWTNGDNRWMTFAPEWLSGTVNLNTSSFMYK